LDLAESDHISDFLNGSNLTSEKGIEAMETALCDAFEKRLGMATFFSASDSVNVIQQIEPVFSAWDTLKLCWTRSPTTAFEAMSAETSDATVLKGRDVLSKMSRGEAVSAAEKYSACKTVLEELRAGQKRGGLFSPQRYLLSAMRVLTTPVTVSAQGSQDTGDTQGSQGSQGTKRSRDALE
jgi:hypothetical protein